MRILHLASGFAIDYPGGVPIYVRALAAAQAANGDEVRVMDGSETAEWQPHADGFLVHGSSRRTPRHITLSMPERRAASAALVTAIAATDPDIVHVHHTFGLGQAVYDAMADSGLPYVVSLHDYHLYCPRVTMIDFTGEYCGGPERRKCERCIGLLDQIDLAHVASEKLHLPLPRVSSGAVTRRNARVARFLAEARVVLAVSNRVGELFRGVYPDARYEVLHIGNSSAAAERPARTDSDRLRLTMLGRLSAYKGSRVLAALATAVKRSDVEFRFYGRTDASEEAAAATAGVRLMGAYRPEDLPDILGSTDIGLALPVWEDNAPQVVMEFLNYGVPVLATRMGGIPDFVDGRNGHLFAPTADGIAEAAAWIDAVDLSGIRALGASFGRLATPEEHRAEVRRRYAAPGSGSNG